MPAPEKNKSLESWIWDAACSIRGAKEVGSRKEALQLTMADHKLVRLYLPLLQDIVSTLLHEQEITA